MRIIWPLLLAACGPPETAPEKGTESSDTALRTPTWHEDVAPILAEHCSGCHAPGGLADELPWTTWDDAALAAGWIAETVSSREMPPFPAETTDRCTPPFPFVGDTHVPADQAAVLRAWAEAGAPEGDPANARPLPSPPSFALPHYDRELIPPQPIVVERRESDNGKVDDLHICWAFDLDLTEEAWLTGLEVIPGNDQVVHHVRIDVGTPADGARANDQGWWPCEATAFGERAANWVPGARPYTTPSGSGLPLPPGAHLVMSVHYHVPTDEPQEDRTTLRIALTDQVPERIVQYLKVGNDAVRYEDGTGLQPGPNDAAGAEFVIPPDTAGHTESFLWRVPESLGPVDVWLVGHHMHYAAVDAVLTVQRAQPGPGEPREVCLLDVPRWDFDWQLFYVYDDPEGQFLRLQPGDVLALRCTYDTTAANTAWSEVMALEGLDAPVSLQLSDGTLSEMCASLIGVLLEP